MRRVLLDPGRWREAATVQRGELLLLPGLRQLAGIALLFGLTWWWLSTPAALAVSTGALMVAMVAVDGPSRARGYVGLMMTLLLALSVSLALLVGSVPLLAALVVGAAAAGFVLLSFAHALYLPVAVICISYLVVYSGAGIAPQAWWAYGLAVLAGGLGQLLFLSVLWPAPPLRDERRQLTVLLGEVAAMLRAVGDGKPPQLALHRSAALERAQLLARPLGLSARETRRMRQSREELLALLSRVYLFDAALCGYAAAAHASDERAGLPALADWVEALAARVASGETRLPDDLRLQLKTLLGVSPPALREMAGVLLGAARALAGERGPTELDVGALPARRSVVPGLFEELRASLWDKEARQFAAFYGAAIAALSLLSSALPWAHSYWLVMTFSLIFSSDFQRLLTRGLGRVSGTALGLLVVFAAERTLGLGGLGSLALYFAALYLVVTTVHAGYATLTFGITIYTFAALQSSDVNAALIERTVFTVAGVLLALLAYRLWPGWQQHRLPQHTAAAAERLLAFVSGLRAGTAAQRPQGARLALLTLGGVFREAALVAGRAEYEPASAQTPAPTPERSRELLQDLETAAAHALGLHAAQLLGRAVPPAQLNALESEAQAVIAELRAPRAGDTNPGAR